MKNTFRILFAVILALTMCIFASALTLDTAEYATETSEITQACLSEASATVVPGLNLLTGTTATFSFEDVDTTKNTGVTADNTTFYRKDKNIATISNAAFWTKATPDNAKNRAMALYGYYPHFTFENMPVVEAERPVQVYFNYINDDGDQTVLLVRNAGNSTSPALKSISVSKTNGAWVSYNAKLESNSIAATSKGSPATYFIDDTKNIKNIWFMRNGTTNAVYLDDIALVPYYKVTYIGLDGETVAATDYVLLDAAGNMLTSYTPDNSKVEGATGYALSADGEKVVSVALNNADIVLYALDVKEAMFVSGDITKNVALTEGNYTIPTAKELGMDIENFRAWTDGSNIYNAGTVIENALSIKGKIFTPICFEQKLFDPAYGDLVFLFDYEGKAAWKDATYINPDYATSIAGRSDQTRTISIEKKEDGTSYMKVANSSGGYQLYGYGVPYNAKTVGGKGTVTFDWAFVTPEQYAGKSIQLRMLNTTAAATADGQAMLGISRPSEIVANEWYKAVVTYVDTKGLGLKGGIVQGQGLSTSANVITNIDNFSFYVYPAKTFAMYEEKDSDNFTKIKIEGDTYTFEAVEGVMAWTDGNGNYFKPGIAYNASDLEFKSLYPFIQDTSEPAVIYIFEGDKGIDGSKIVQNNGSASYGENIVDDGRTVLHLHAWNKKAAKDYRITFKYAEQYDVNEYKHFQFMYKTNNVYKADANASSGYSPEASWASCVYVNYNGNGGYYSTNPYVLYQFNSRSYTEADADGYVILEKDLSTIGTKEGYPIGYGFSIDPVNSGNTRWGHDIYVDYIRVYRSGVTTVTYDTNAPEGATVIAEVPADTNRGLGTGYYLKGLRPAVEGYIFMGWALTPNATAAETIESFDLTGDTTVYAVWAKAEEKTAPEMTSEVEIRGGESNGIRFKSEITPAVKAGLDEFGFIATREVLLPFADAEKTTRDYSKLTFLHKVNGANAAYYVQGVAYDKDAEIDVINSESEDGNVVYSAVVTGVPMEKKNEKMVVRPYAKFAVNGKEMIVYGDASAASLYDTALAVKNANGASYANNKAFIDSVLAE